jgi:hypothetical protein
MYFFFALNKHLKGDATMPQGAAKLVLKMRQSVPDSLAARASIASKTLRSSGSAIYTPAADEAQAEDRRIMMGLSKKAAAAPGPPAPPAKAQAQPKQPKQSGESEAELAKCRAELAANETERSSLEREKQKAESELVTARKEKEGEKQKAESARKEKEDANGRLDTYRIQVTQKDAEIAQKEAEIATALLAAKEAKDSLKTLRHEAIECKRNVADLQKSLGDTNNKLNEENQRSRRLTAELAQATVHLAQAETSAREANRLGDKIKHIRIELAKCNDEKRELFAERQLVSKVKHDEEKKLEEKVNVANALRAELDALKLEFKQLMTERDEAKRAASEFEAELQPMKIKVAEVEAIIANQMQLLVDQEQRHTKDTEEIHEKHAEFAREERARLDREVIEQKRALEDAMEQQARDAQMVRDLEASTASYQTKLTTAARRVEETEAELQRTTIELEARKSAAETLARYIDPECGGHVANCAQRRYKNKIKAALLVCTDISTQVALNAALNDVHSEQHTTSLEVARACLQKAMPQRLAADDDVAAILRDKKLFERASSTKIMAFAREIHATNETTRACRALNECKSDLAAVRSLGELDTQLESHAACEQHAREVKSRLIQMFNQRKRAMQDTFDVKGLSVDESSSFSDLRSTLGRLYDAFRQVATDITLRAFYSPEKTESVSAICEAVKSKLLALDVPEGELTSTSMSEVNGRLKERVDRVRVCLGSAEYDEIVAYASNRSLTAFNSTNLQNTIKNLQKLKGMEQHCEQLRALESEYGPEGEVSFVGDFDMQKAACKDRRDRLKLSEIQTLRNIDGHTKQESMFETMGRHAGGIVDESLFNRLSHNDTAGIVRQIHLKAIEKTLQEINTLKADKVQHVARGNETNEALSRERIRLNAQLADLKQQVAELAQKLGTSRTMSALRGACRKRFRDIRTTALSLRVDIQTPTNITEAEKIESIAAHVYKIDDLESQLQGEIKHQVANVSTICSSTELLGNVDISGTKRTGMLEQSGAIANIRTYVSSVMRSSSREYDQICALLDSCQVLDDGQSTEIDTDAIGFSNEQTSFIVRLIATYAEAEQHALERIAKLRNITKDADFPTTGASASEKLRSALQHTQSVLNKVAGIVRQLDGIVQEESYLDAQFESVQERWQRITPLLYIRNADQQDIFHLVHNISAIAALRAETNTLCAQTQTSCSELLGLLTPETAILHRAHFVVSATLDGAKGLVDAEAEWQRSHGNDTTQMLILSDSPTVAEQLAYIKRALSFIDGVPVSLTQAVAEIQRKKREREIRTIEGYVKLLRSVTSQTADAGQVSLPEIRETCKLAIEQKTNKAANTTDLRLLEHIWHDHVHADSVRQSLSSLHTASKYNEMERGMAHDDDINLALITKYANELPIHKCSEHTPVHTGVISALQFAALAAFAVEHQRRLRAIIDENTSVIVDALMCCKGHTADADSPSRFDAVRASLMQFTTTVLQNKTAGLEAILQIGHRFASTEQHLLTCLKIPLVCSQSIQHTSTYLMQIARVARDAAKMSTLADNFTENILFGDDDSFYNAVIADVVFRVHTILLFMAANVADAPQLKQWIEGSDLEYSSRYLTGAVISSAIMTPEVPSPQTQQLLLNVLSVNADATLAACYQNLVNHLRGMNRLPDSTWQARQYAQTVEQQIGISFPGDIKADAIRRLRHAEQQLRIYLDPHKYPTEKFNEMFNKYAACILGLIFYSMRIDILFSIAWKRVNATIRLIEPAVPEGANFGSRSRRDERRGRRGPRASPYV